MRWTLSALVLTAAGCTCGSRLTEVTQGLAIDPDLVDFGQVPTNSEASRVVTFTNEGKQTLTLALGLQNDVRGRFSADDTRIVLQPGDRRSLKLHYVTTSPGEDSAELLCTVGGQAYLVVLRGVTVAAVVVDGGLNERPVDLADSGVSVDAGTLADAGSGAADACVALTCRDVGRSCGSVPDGCGGAVQCGACSSGFACSALGQCLCAPTGVEQCGNGVDDDCDGLADCADPECSSFAACAPVACATGAEVQLTHNTTVLSSGAPDLVTDGTNLGVAWLTYDQGPTTMSYDYARLTPALWVSDGPTRIVTGVAHPPRLTWSGDSWGVGYCDTGPFVQHTFVQRFATDGGALGAAVQMGAGFPMTVTRGATSGSFGSMWGQRAPADARSVFGRVAGSSRVGGDVPLGVDGGVDYGDLVWNGQGWAAAWTDLSTYATTASNSVAFQRLDATGTALGTSTMLTVSGAFPRLVWTGSEYGVTWTDHRDGNPEIYFARLDANGQKIGTELRVTNAPGQSYFSALAWTGASFQLVWTDDRTGAPRVYRVALNAQGVKTGVESLVSCGTGDSRSASVAWLGPKVAIGWTEQRNGAQDVFVKLVDP